MEGLWFKFIYLHTVFSVVRDCRRKGTTSQLMVGVVEWSVEPRRASMSRARAPMGCCRRELSKGQSSCGDQSGLLEARQALAGPDSCSSARAFVSAQPPTTAHDRTAPLDARYVSSVSGVGLETLCI